MRRLAEIQAAYTRLDLYLETLRLTSPVNQVAHVESAQALNDQAYFVLCWGQLETEINERCGDVIRAKQASPDWQSRRGWDRYNAGDLKSSGLSFEDRAAVVLDRLKPKPNNYGVLIQFYSTRNQIAHGKLLSQRLDVVDAIARFHLISAEINRHAP